MHDAAASPATSRARRATLGAGCLIGLLVTGVVLGACGSSKNAGASSRIFVPCGRFQGTNAIARPAQPTPNQRVSEMQAMTTLTTRVRDSGSDRVSLRSTAK